VQNPEEIFAMEHSHKQKKMTIEFVDYHRLIIIRKFTGDITGL